MKQKVSFDKLAVGVCCAFALPFAYGRSATVSLAPDPQAENALLVSFVTRHDWARARASAHREVTD